MPTRIIVVVQNVTLLIPEPYRSEHNTHLARYQQAGGQRVIGKGRELIDRRKNGPTFPFELVVSEGRVGGRRMFPSILSAAEPTCFPSLPQAARPGAKREDSRHGGRLFGNTGFWRTGERADRVDSCHHRFDG